MITTEVDVSSLKELGGKMLTLREADTLLRLIAEGMLGATHDRIHTDGKKSDGSKMGTYSPKYLELRKKPPAEGGTSDSDPNIRLFFTGQMQLDYKIIPISDTEYGLGFSNEFNAQKANYAEERFGEIYALTDQEMQGLRDIVSEYVQQIFK